MSPSDSRHPFASDSITARAGALNLRVSDRSEANVGLTKASIEKTGIRAERCERISSLFVVGAEPHACLCMSCSVSSRRKERCGSAMSKPRLALHAAPKREAIWLSVWARAVSWLWLCLLTSVSTFAVDIQHRP